MERDLATKELLEIWHAALLKNSEIDRSPFYIFARPPSIIQWNGQVTSESLIQYLL